MEDEERDYSGDLQRQLDGKCYRLHWGPGAVSWALKEIKRLRAEIERLEERIRELEEE